MPLSCATRAISRRSSVRRKPPAFLLIRLSLDSPPRSFVFSNGIGLTPIVLCSAAFVFDWVLEAKERLEQIGRILQFLYQTEILVRPPESFTGTFILCPRTEVGRGVWAHRKKRCCCRGKRSCRRTRRTRRRSRCSRSRASSSSGWSRRTRVAVTTRMMMTMINTQILTSARCLCPCVRVAYTCRCTPSEAPRPSRRRRCARGCECGGCQSGIGVRLATPARVAQTAYRR